MNLSPGTRLGSYEITSVLGAGGMGEVYRGRDTKLNRNVAIKVLPEMFALDPERLARFEREAQVLAALNHPNIAQIYGVEGTALVMELVEGEDLAVIIARGAIPIADALAIARQIADALDAAHELGTVHRDLKPANIKVRADGTVKVLDFGLAKAMDPGGASSANAIQSPTFTAHATAMGVIVGTAAYMAPEQARGKAVDRRADLWASGVVLYEMLTGVRPFVGDTITDVLAAVVKESPDWSRLPVDTPPALRRLLQRSLEKDARRRLRDAGDARLEIEDLISGVSSSGPARPVSANGTRPRSRVRGVAVAMAMLIVTGAAAMAGWMLKPTRDLPLRKFTIRAKDGGRIVDAAIAPDGRAVVYLANDNMWVQRLDSVTPQEMSGVTEVHALFWSPDSSLIGFQSKGQLWKIPAAGGNPSPICRVPREFSASGGANWLPGDRIVFSTGGSGLMEVSALGGEPRMLLAPDLKMESDLHQVSALPQGKGFLFVPHTINSPMTAIDLYDGTARRAVFTRPGNPLDYPIYASPGYLLFGHESGVWALKFSLADGKPSGAPFLVATSSSHPTVADDGTVAMVTDERTTEHMQLSWVDRSGALISPVGRVGRMLIGPRISPNGRMIVGAARGDTNATSDLWIVDLDRHNERRLTYEPGINNSPEWSVDGKSVVYSCDAGVCTRAADGTGQAVVVVAKPASVPALSPDGRTVMFTREQPVTSQDIFIAPLRAGGVITPAGSERPLIVAERMQHDIEVSPDGTYAAYVSNESGINMVYVTEFPSARGKWQVGAGMLPRWNGKGDRLYIDVADRIMEVEVTTVPSVSISEPRPLFSGQSVGVAIPGVGFQPSPDGSRFLVNRSTVAASNTAITIVQNWFAEFAAGARK